MWPEAFRLCRELKIPHPNKFEAYGIDYFAFMDWIAVFQLIDEEIEKVNGPSDKDKFDAFIAAREKLGA